MRVEVEVGCHGEGEFTLSPSASP